VCIVRALVPDFRFDGWYPDRQPACRARCSLGVLGQARGQEGGPLWVKKTASRFSLRSTDLFLSTRATASRRNCVPATSPAPTTGTSCSCPNSSASRRKASTSPPGGRRLRETRDLRGVGGPGRRRSPRRGRSWIRRTH